MSCGDVNVRAFASPALRKPAGANHAQTILLLPEIQFFHDPLPWGEVGDLAYRECRRGNQTG